MVEKSALIQKYYKCNKAKFSPVNVFFASICALIDLDILLIYVSNLSAAVAKQN